MAGAPPVLEPGSIEARRGDAMSATIVCGVDGSGEARRAASLAGRLTRDLGSRALLVHVEEDAHKPPLGLRWPRPGRARRRKKVLRATAEECCFPSETELQLRRGDPTAELMAVAEKEDAELVVVSAGGRGTAGPALLGGTASGLMRSCPCPVVVVPTKSIPPLDTEGMRSVVCGVEGRETDAPALRLAADLATRLGGELHAVHGYERAEAPTPPGPAGSPEDELHATAERTLAFAVVRAGVHARRHVLPLPIHEALERVARQERAGLTVAGPPDAGETTPLAIRLAAESSTALVVLTAEAELEAGSGHYELTASPA
jgi:nucleotide-binding universal stress UspA family protein